MRKKSSKKAKDDPVVRDWKPLLGAVRDVVDWSLDIAVRLARGIDEDVVAIENVRASFHGWLDGKPTEIEVNDLLVTFGTILAAIEIDLGIDSSSAVSPMQAIADSLPTLCFPGVERCHENTVVIRRCPGARGRATCRCAA